MATGTELQERAGRLAGQLEKQLGQNLHSCVLYGSAVRGDASPQASDINLLIILTLATPTKSCSTLNAKKPGRLLTTGR